MVMHRNHLDLVKPSALLFFLIGLACSPLYHRGRELLASLAPAHPAFVQAPWVIQKHERATLVLAAIGKSRPIVFLGDSRVEECPWEEWLHRTDISNRGIGGDTTQALLDRLPSDVPSDPHTCMLQTGVNDLIAGDRPEDVAERIQRIVAYLHNRKATLVILTSIIAAGQNQDALADHLNARITQTNALLRRIEGVTYVDLNARLTTKDGYLDPQLSNDGIHLNAAGYTFWRDAIQPLLPQVTQAETAQAGEQNL